MGLMETLRNTYRITALSLALALPYQSQAQQLDSALGSFFRKAGETVSGAKPSTNPSKSPSTQPSRYQIEKAIRPLSKSIVQLASQYPVLSDDTNTTYSIPYEGMGFLVQGRKGRYLVSAGHTFITPPQRLEESLANLSIKGVKNPRFVESNKAIIAGGVILNEKAIIYQDETRDLAILSFREDPVAEKYFKQRDFSFLKLKRNPKSSEIGSPFNWFRAQDGKYSRTNEIVRSIVTETTSDLRNKNWFNISVPISRGESGSLGFDNKGNPTGIIVARNKFGHRGVVLEINKVIDALESYESIPNK